MKRLFLNYKGNASCVCQVAYCSVPLSYVLMFFFCFFSESFLLSKEIITKCCILQVSKYPANHIGLSPLHCDTSESYTMQKCGSGRDLMSKVAIFTCTVPYSCWVYCPILMLSLFIVTIWVVCFLQIIIRSVVTSSKIDLSLEDVYR